MSEIILSALMKDFVEKHSLGNLPDPDLMSRFSGYCTLASAIGNDPDLMTILEDIDVDGGQDNSLDMICIIANGQVILSEDDIADLERTKRLEVDFYFVQAKSEKTFDQAKIGSFIAGVRNFFDPLPLLASNEKVNALRDLKDQLFKNTIRFVRNPRLHLIYATKGLWKEPKEILDRVKQELKPLYEESIFSSIAFQPFDSPKLSKTYRELSNSIEREVEFDKHTILPSIEGIEEAYIGVLSAAEFFKLITTDSGEINRTLFYDNVRDFLGDNPVNAEIAETLNNQNSSRRFGILNNGVTIVAQALRKIGSKFALTGFQIVNGCQTSNVLFSHRSNIDEAKVFIPIKLIVTQDQEVRSSVVKATNRQTEVKLEAFEALRPIHAKIEEYYSAKSKSSTDRVFYERRNRQYIDSNIKPHEVISLAAQIKSFVAMMLLEPHSTHRYYGELLNSYRDRLFQDKHSPALYYASGLGLVKIEALIREGAVAKHYREFRYHLLGLLRIGTIGTDDNLFGKMQSTVETTLVKLLSDEDALRKQMVVLCKLIDQTPKDGLPRFDVCRRRLFTDKLFDLASRSFGPSVEVGRKIRPQGVVTYWNDDRGFGFVRLDERFNGEVSDAFVHFRSLIEIYPRRLDKDRRVECDLIEGHKGLEAHNVRYV